MTLQERAWLMTLQELAQIATAASSVAASSEGTIAS
jgi:hypothetical protein